MCIRITNVLALTIVAGCSAPPPPSTPPTTVTVVQRESEFIPGTDDRLRVSLGDITANQVLVRVVDTATGHDVVPQVSMRVGDHADVEFAGRRHALVLQRLRNLLIGDDFAVFAWTVPDAVGVARIDGLLARIESSSWVFVRNGEDHTGADAAAHLRRKWQAAGSEPREVDAFLDAIATRSSTTGEEYLVRLPSGRTVPLATWLRSDAIPIESP